LSWFSTAFVGAKGGVRYKILPVVDDYVDQNSGSDAQLRYTYVGRPPLPTAVVSHTLSGAFTDLLSSMSAGTWPPVAFAGAGGVMAMADNGMVEIELPDYQQTYFRKAAPQNTIETYCKYEQVGIYPVFSSGSGVNVGMTVWAAAADDFSLFLYAGAPTLKKTSP